MSSHATTSPSPAASHTLNDPLGAPRVWPRWVGPVALLVLMVIGGVLRLLNLGELTYQVDEGYQLSGVKGILAHGVPMLETGHAYVRAPLFLYSEALCAEVLGLNPLSMRLPAAVFGVLCIPVALRFGKTLVNPAVGWTLAVFVTFSQWHVELSRYARFYTLLAAVVMLALLAFHHGYMQRKFWGKVAFWLLALLAISIHDTAVSLGMAFVVLLPWRDQSWCRRIGLFIQAGVIGVAWVAYRKGLDAWGRSLSSPDLHLVHTTNTEAQDAAAQAAKKPLSFLPDVKLPSLANTLDAWSHGVWMMAVPVVVGVVGIGWAALAAAKSKQTNKDAWSQAAVASLIVLCAVLHQGALAMLLAVAAMAWWVKHRRDLVSPLGAGMLASFLVMGFHAAVNVKFLEYGYTRGVVWLFKYPDWSRYALEWLWHGWMPMLLALPLGLAILMWWARDREGRPAGPWLIVGFLLLGFSLGGMAEGQFNEARYFFYLSALILATYAAVWVWLGMGLSCVLRVGPRGRSIVIGLVVAGGMLVCQDLRPDTAWSVTQRGYDSDRNWVRGVFNWWPFADFHEDVQSVSVFVGDHLSSDDRVLSVGPPHRGTLVYHFAGRLDYIVAQPMVFTLKWEDEDGHWHEPVTGAEIVGTPERLLEVIEQLDARGSKLWVVSNDRMTLPTTYLIDEGFADVLDQITPRATHAMRGRDHSSFAAVAVLPEANEGVQEAESEPVAEPAAEPEPAAEAVPSGAAGEAQEDVPAGDTAEAESEALLEPAVVEE